MLAELAGPVEAVELAELAELVEAVELVELVEAAGLAELAELAEVVELAGPAAGLVFVECLSLLCSLESKDCRVPSAQPTPSLDHDGIRRLTAAAMNCGMQD